jgi:hypothetical protein
MQEVSTYRVGRVLMTLPRCIVTGTALRSLSSVALSSVPVKLFYHASGSETKAVSRRITSSSRLSDSGSESSTSPVSV